MFVDYQFFDMVVRNVIPSDPNQTNNTLPDNGVMMVNPRDITVVFSPADHGAGSADQRLR